ncbi:MAG: hypothetical protein LBF69_01375 [Prevotellaceae bacterium]|nr:hypothetical protein [Prevotellaceae bacterium]
MQKIENEGKNHPMRERVTCDNLPYDIIKTDFIPGKRKSSTYESVKKYDASRL